jgi:hypothetical protein
MTTFAEGQARLLELADILDRADEEHRAKGEPGYSQRRFLHHCGTPSCALGHWAAAHPERWTMMTGIPGRWMPFNQIDPALTAGMHEFCITGGEWEELFEGIGCGGAKTAKQAAAYIREFVKRREQR